MTNSTRLFTTLAFLTASTLAACGSKAPPKSTTTTRTQSTTTTDTGDSTSTDSTEKTTLNPDGSSTVQTNETTNKTAPATPSK